MRPQFVYLPQTVKTMRVGLLLFLSLVVASTKASIMLNAVVYLPQGLVPAIKKFRPQPPKLQVELMKKTKEELELEKLQAKIEKVLITLHYIMQMKKAPNTKIVDLRLNRL